MKKIAVFDFDGTLFENESMPFIWSKYGELGFSRFRQTAAIIKIVRDKLITDKLLSKKQKFKDLGTIHMHKMFNGMDNETVDKFFEDIAPEVMKGLNENVVEELKRLQKENYTTLLISGCFEPLIKVIAKNLDIDYAFATKIPFRDGVVEVDNANVQLVNGTNKLEIIDSEFVEDDIDWDNSYAYSDSITDLDLLKRFGNPIAVNPDIQLMEYAQKNNITII